MTMDIKKSYKISKFKRGLTDSKVANKLGIHTNALRSRIGYNNPSADFINQLASVFDYTTSEFIALGE